MDHTFKLEHEYASTDFILFESLDVNESIQSGRLLFKTLHLSHDGSGNVIEKTPTTFSDQGLDSKEAHKIHSCIPFNNEQHQNAWNMFLDCSRQNLQGTSEHSEFQLRYIDKVMNILENWFYINKLQKELKINRLFLSDDFRSVQIRQQNYILTESQAIVIKYLYEQYLRNTPEVTSAKVINMIDEERGTITSKKRLIDVFKKNKNAYKDLIIQGSVKGHVKINIF
jgi:hypothetical protein